MKASLVRLWEAQRVGLRIVRRDSPLEPVNYESGETVSCPRCLHVYEFMETRTNKTKAVILIGK